MNDNPTPPPSGPPPFSTTPPPSPINLHHALVALQRSLSYSESADQFPDRHDHHTQARIALREAASLFGPAFARTIDADLREVEENRHIVHAMPINTMRLWVALAVSLQAKLDAVQLDDDAVNMGLHWLRAIMASGAEDNPAQVAAVQRLILVLEGWLIK